MSELKSKNELLKNFPCLWIYQPLSFEINILFVDHGKILFIKENKINSEKHI
jgi:hypothetical protein